LGIDEHLQPEFDPLEMRAVEKRARKRAREHRLLCKRTHLSQQSRAVWSQRERAGGLAGEADVGFELRKGPLSVSDAGLLLGPFLAAGGREKAESPSSKGAEWRRKRMAWPRGEGGSFLA